MTLSDAIVFYFLLGLRLWEILMFLKSEESISEYVNIEQTSEAIGTVQEKSPVGRGTSGSLPVGAVEPDFHKDGKKLADSEFAVQ